MDERRDPVTGTSTGQRTHPEVALMTVGETASATGVTVRTLHHYDRIGLVTPAARSSAGYRLYGPDDVDRLQRVVAYRRLGLGLADIAAALADEDVDADGDAADGDAADGDAANGTAGAARDIAGSGLTNADGVPPAGGRGPDHDAGAPVRGRAPGRRRALERQRELVEEKITELTRLLAALDTALEKDMKDIDLTQDEMRELFGEHYTENFVDYQEEAQQRWGETDAWAESRRRTQRYTKADWEKMRDEEKAVNARIVEAMDAGLPAGSEQAMDAAEAARGLIDRWFYSLDAQFHRNLGDMYVQDPRFTAAYEQQRPGLAQYLRDAIHANADRLERQQG